MSIFQKYILLKCGFRKKSFIMNAQLIRGAFIINEFLQNTHFSVIYERPLTGIIGY